jgi:tetratricopeptide (TPR) repeat protein
MALPVKNAHGQIFPEVISPANIQRQQDQENEKLAFQYYSEKDYEKALVLFHDLYDKQPNQHLYTYYLYCLTALNKFSEAEKLVKSKIKNEAGSYKYEVDLGYIYLVSNKPEKATRAFDDLIENMGPNRANITEIANAFLTRQLYEYAIKTYLRGRELPFTEFQP